MHGTLAYSIVFYMVSDLGPRASPHLLSQVQLGLEQKEHLVVETHSLAKQERMVYITYFHNSPQHNIPFTLICILFYLYLVIWYVHIGCLWAAESLTV